MTEIKRRPTSAQEASAPKSSGKTYFVALKLPNGLVLENFEEYEVRQPTALGFTTEKLMRRTGERFFLKGNADPTGMNRIGYLSESGGYAITAGVPADLFDRWWHLNQDTELVRNGLIFATNSHEDAAAEGRKLVAVRSGLEPIDPKNPGLTVPGRKSRINGLGSVTHMESYNAEGASA